MHMIWDMQASEAVNKFKNERKSWPRIGLATNLKLISGLFSMKTFQVSFELTMKVFVNNFPCGWIRAFMYLDLDNQL